MHRVSISQGTNNAFFVRSRVHYGGQIVMVGKTTTSHGCRREEYRYVQRHGLCHSNWCSFHTNKFLVPNEVLRTVKFSQSDR